MMSATTYSHFLRVDLSPAWLRTWQEVVEACRAEIRRYNQAHGYERIGIRIKDQVRYLIEVFWYGAPQGKLWTVTLEVVDEYKGELSMICPPHGPGINSHGNFRMVNGRILTKPDFTGRPQPPAQMTPRELASDFLIHSGFLPE
jgi:hypothetical protein